MSSKANNPIQAEREQAFIRLFVTVIVLLYLFFFKNSHPDSGAEIGELLILFAALLVFSVVMYLLIIGGIASPAVRRITGISVDNTVIGYLVSGRKLAIFEGL
ncbi:MAG: hypothetical protein KZQ58_04365 [gamma proteobacterium symbiont of Bathyaustriella thionipta]|nr:hypothetical protein [gamma proteobacterium symbiont of Bathyaustriella thionipta]